MKKKFNNSKILISFGVVAVAFVLGFSLIQKKVSAITTVSVATNLSAHANLLIPINVAQVLNTNGYTFEFNDVIRGTTSDIYASNYFQVTGDLQATNGIFISIPSTITLKHATTTDVLVADLSINTIGAQGAVNTISGPALSAIGGSWTAKINSTTHSLSSVTVGTGEVFFDIYARISGTQISSTLLAPGSYTFTSTKPEESIIASYI